MLSTNFASDPFFSTTSSSSGVLDYHDPMLSQCTTKAELRSYIGTPRINIDMSEKEDQYVYAIGRF